MILTLYPWASECPDVKNYKWRLNPVCYRVLVLYSCTHMATEGVKWLIGLLYVVLIPGLWRTLIWRTSPKVERSNTACQWARPCSAWRRRGSRTMHWDTELSSGTCSCLVRTRSGASVSPDETCTSQCSEHQAYIMMRGCIRLCCTPSRPCRASDFLETTETSNLVETAVNKSNYRENT